MEIAQNLRTGLRIQEHLQKILLVAQKETLPVTQRAGRKAGLVAQKETLPVTQKETPPVNPYVARFAALAKRVKSRHML